MSDSYSNMVCPECRTLEAQQELLKVAQATERRQEAERNERFEADQAREAAEADEQNARTNALVSETSFKRVQDVKEMLLAVQHANATYDGVLADARRSGGITSVGQLRDALTKVAQVYIIPLADHILAQHKESKYLNERANVDLVAYTKKGGAALLRFRQLRAECTAALPVRARDIACGQEAVIWVPQSHRHVSFQEAVSLLMDPTAQFNGFELFPLWWQVRVVGHDEHRSLFAPAMSARMKLVAAEADMHAGISVIDWLRSTTALLVNSVDAYEITAGTHWKSHMKPAWASWAATIPTAITPEQILKPKGFSASDLRPLVHGLHQQAAQLPPVHSAISQVTSRIFEVLDANLHHEAALSFDHAWAALDPVSEPPSAESTMSFGSAATKRYEQLLQTVSKGQGLKGFFSEMWDSTSSRKAKDLLWSERESLIAEHVRAIKRDWYGE